MNYRKIFMSLSLIVFVSALVVGGTQAFFSDTESSTGNVLAAGAIDLRIDNHAWYNGLECAFVDGGIDDDDNQDNDETGYYWQDPGDNAGNDPYLQSLIGTACQSTWDLKDLDSGDLFFNLTDLKPGDWEEDTISFHVDNNDAWVCGNLRATMDDDVSSTEPELEDGDTQEVDTDFWDGELGQELNFIFWADDGDNVFEDDETIVLEGTPATLTGYGSTDGNNGETFPLADSTYNVWQGGEANTPLPAGEDAVYIGKAFCYGTIEQTPVDQDGETGDNSPATDPGFICNGASATNIGQTDRLEGDLRFYAVQSRNNEDFVCSNDSFDEGEGQEPARELVGAALGAYSAPTPDQCDLTVGDPASSVVNYATIQEAIDAADGPTTICVADGSYDEDVTINKDDITLLGDGAVNTSVINGQSANFGGALVIDGNNAEVQGFIINGGTGSQHAVRFATGVSGATFSNNEVNAPSGGNAILMQGSQSNHSVGNNVLVGDASPQVAYVNGDVSLGGQSSDNVDFVGNTFEGTIVSGGVAFGTEATNVDFTNNNIADTLTSTYAVTEFFKADALVNFNNFNGANTDVKVQDGNASADLLNAENNWWGDLNPADNIGGDVDFDPFEASAFPLN